MGNAALCLPEKCLNTYPRIGKPYEPRRQTLFPTTPEGVLLGQQVEAMLEAEVNQELLAEGHSLVSVNPEVGHVHMGDENLAYAFSWPLSVGRSPSAERGNV